VVFALSSKIDQHIGGTGNLKADSQFFNGSATKAKLNRTPPIRQLTRHVRFLMSQISVATDNVASSSWKNVPWLFFVSDYFSRFPFL